MSRTSAAPRGCERLVAALLLGACSDAALPAPGPDDRGTVVVGVLSDLEPGHDIGRLHAVLQAGDTVVTDVVLGASDPAAPLSFPHELRFERLPGGTPVTVSLDAYIGAFSDEKPLVSRLAATAVVGGETRLLRVRIERECIPNAQLGGGRVAPTCTPPETCVAAACTDPYVPPGELEEYRSDWATDFADACKPASPGPPAVELGQGQDAFSLLGDGDVAQLFMGDQGGYHVWVSIQTRNLHQSGSTTKVSGRAEALDEPLDSFAVVQGYDPVGGGACELLGIRYEMPSAFWNDIEQLYGQPVQLDVEVVDVAGDVGFVRRHVVLSSGFE